MRWFRLSARAGAGDLAFRSLRVRPTRFHLSGAGVKAAGPLQNFIGSSITPPRKREERTRIHMGIDGDQGAGLRTNGSTIRRFRGKVRIEFCYTLFLSCMNALQL